MPKPPPDGNKPPSTPERQEVTFSGDITPGAIQSGDAAPFNSPAGPALKITRELHSGPVPMPSVMGGYRDIDPSFPGRILTMAEQNAATERKTQERAQVFQFTEAVLGKVFAVGFALAAMWIAFRCAQTGHDQVASVLGGATIVGVVGSLVASRVIKPRG